MTDHNTFLTPEERTSLDSIDIHALLREHDGETAEGQVKRLSNTAMKFFREICDMRKELALWQQFASYCRSCALSGESNPLDFDSFDVGSISDQCPINP